METKFFLATNVLCCKVKLKGALRNEKRKDLILFEVLASLILTLNCYSSAA